MGRALYIVGALVMLFALMSTGAVSGSTTLNLGLLVDKIVLMLFGGFLWLAGIVIAINPRKRS